MPHVKLTRRIAASTIVRWLVAVDGGDALVGLVARARVRVRVRGVGWLVVRCQLVEFSNTRKTTNNLT